MNETAAGTLQEGDRAYRELSAELDSDPERPLHGEGGGQWTARDVYVHLYRWQEWATDALAESLASGKLVEAYAGDDEMEAINARWQREGSALSFEEARTRCEASRVAMQAAFGALDDAEFGRWGAAYGAEFDGSHYRGHLAYIRGAG